MKRAAIVAIIESIRAAGREGCVYLALIVAIAALVLAWLAVNPVQQAADHVVAPVGRSVGILESRCPGGWDDISQRGVDTPVFVCAKGSWRVVLGPAGKTFQYAVELNRPGAEIIYDAGRVPGW